MQIKRIESFTKGWVIGDFEPTLHKTKEFEVATQTFEKGEHASRHMHKIAKEFTIIVSGKATMEGKLVKTGDVIVIEPGEATDFHALEPTTTLVVKIPSVKGDKYECP